MATVLRGHAFGNLLQLNPAVEQPSAAGSFFRSLLNHCRPG
jgi:hypothetical protein